MAAPKFKISMGAPKSSSKPTAAPSKRRRSMLEDDVDAGDDDEQNHTSEQILHFDAHARAAAPEKARVIPAVPNRDWREERERKRLKSGAKDGAEESVVEMRDVVNGDAPAGGLTVVEKRKEDAEHDETTPAGNDAVDTDKTVERSIDEQAMDALMGKGGTHSTVVIAPPSPPATEDEAFKRGFAEAPPPATLDEYSATPVEGFGAAILRGYLKPGQTLEDLANGSGKGKGGEVKRRAGLLGLGAKESGLGVELGAWGKSARKGKKDEVGYMPLALKNKRTGEVLTEEELKDKLKEQEEQSHNRERSRRESDDEGSSRRDKHKRDRDRDRERKLSSRDKDDDRRSYKSSRYDRDESERSRRREEAHTSSRDRHRNGDSRGQARSERDYDSRDRHRDRHSHRERSRERASRH